MSAGRDGRFGELLLKISMQDDFGISLDDKDSLDSERISTNDKSRRKLECSSQNRFEGI